jgi:excinuclease ABC subunit C
MTNLDFKKIKLPNTPGVYFFKKGKEILYIGKATSLKDRVRSYFDVNLIGTRGPFLVDMVFRANKIDYIKTDSVLESIILEANLIKKYQPKYNTKEKDNKSFNYVVITKEDFPRVLVVRGRNLEKNFTEPVRRTFGPFSNSSQLREVLKIIRRIFPYRDRCVPLAGKPCFNRQIGLCPGVCEGKINIKDYKIIIRKIELLLSGKIGFLKKSLKKEMDLFSKKQEFEKAKKIRDQIFSLNHIQDVSLIKEDEIIQKKAQTQVLGSPPLLRNKCRPDHSSDQFSESSYRIEAYDVAHLSGTNNVGVMVVMEDGDLVKNDYRKFNIQKSKGNDVGALKEILERRFRHTEWTLPNLIVVDGGMAQINTAKKVLNDLKVSAGIVAVIKDEKHKAKAILGEEKLVKNFKKKILLINNESHRFAIAFHRQRRNVIL